MAGKNILLLLGEVGFISRTKIITSIVSEAKKDGNNIFLFTSEGVTFHIIDSYIRGEYEIYRLPCFENFDGVIIDINSIHDDNTIQYIKECISRTHIPCVSLHHDLEGAVTISYEYRDAFADLIEHLILDHGYTDIDFLTGHKIDDESNLRTQIFIDTLKKHNVPVDDSHIHAGSFDVGSGKKLARRLAAEGNLPQAIVCANDFMAFGLIQGFQKAGIRCPEDVAVTGLDHTELGQMIQPQLSTIDLNDKELGLKAYESVLALSNGELLDDRISVNGWKVIGASCGCSISADSVAKCNSYARDVTNNNQSLDLIKNINITCENVKTLFEFEQYVNPFIPQMGIEYFYYCQCGTRESYYQDLEMYTNNADSDTHRTYSDYNNTAWCPIAYERGEWKNYSAFDLSELLPPTRKATDGSYYIIMPIHNGTDMFGYVVMGNFNGSLPGRVLQHLVMSFDHIISNMRKNDITETILASVNKKWQYDELTQIYNRSGFYQKVQPLFKTAEEQKLGFMTIFFDLDELKHINDIEGHKAGDEYIKSMAGQLKVLSGPHTIAVRFGGDEFILVSLESSEDACRQKCEQIKEQITKYVSASMGMAFGKAANQTELNLLIQEADKRMYEDKLSRKKGLPD